MSSRRFLLEGTKKNNDIVAESKRYIPIGWLALLSDSNADQLNSRLPVQLTRKRALKNFEANAPFLKKILRGVLPFPKASADLAERLNQCTKRDVVIDIGQLTENSDEYFDDWIYEDFGDLLGAIKSHDDELKSEVNNFLNLCWIGAQDLKQKPPALREFVTGYIWLPDDDDEEELDTLDLESVFLIPPGQHEFRIVIWPNGWTERGSPPTKQITEIDESVIQQELSSLDWKTAYSGREPRNDVPELILSENNGKFHIRASGSTESKSDYKIRAECCFVDESGYNHRYESGVIRSPNRLAKLFLSFYRNDESWKQLVKWKP